MGKRGSDEPGPAASRRRAAIRYVFLCVDASEALNRRDMVPDRATHVSAAARRFCTQFFDSNPLGQLGLLLTREGVCRRLVPLSGDSGPLLRALRESLDGSTGSGSASVENVIRRAVADLSSAPPHVTRELLLLFSAMQTCDPGSVHDAIKLAADAGVRCSVVGLGGSLRVLERVAAETGGVYRTPLHELHLRQLMAAHVAPTEAASASAHCFLLMGFPTVRKGAVLMPPEQAEAESAAALVCPRCGCASSSSLPAVCGVCGLSTADAGHVARAYHCFLPPAGFVADPAPDTCAGCAAPSDHRCLACANRFCRTCADFASCDMHMCPGCL